MKIVRTSVINLTAEESETLIAAGNLLRSIYQEMDDDECIFDYDDDTIRALSNALLDAGAQSLIIVTRR